MTSTGWAEAQSIDDVLDRMETISSALPTEDGVATFNRMYHQVTRLVDVAIDQGRFGAGPFLGRLDVHFANLFFEAYAADLDGREVNDAWAPLFDNRRKPRTHPIQFALAGMNAHICHDLPSAVVLTCRELGVDPVDDIKGWFSNGVVARLDEIGGRLDDGFAMFGIHVARAGAWQVAQMLWDLADNPRLDAMFRGNLGRGVGLASRGILI